MSGLTSYYAQKAAGLLFSGQTWSPPSTYYWLPFTGDPSDLGTLNLSVVTTRISRTMSAPDANGLVTLSADLSWAETAPETITHVGAFDASSGGHFCIVKKLDKAMNYYAGDTIVVPKFSIQLAPGIDLTEVDGSA